MTEYRTDAARAVSLRRKRVRDNTEEAKFTLLYCLNSLIRGAHARSDSSCEAKLRFLRDLVRRKAVLPYYAMLYNLRSSVDYVLWLKNLKMWKRLVARSRWFLEMAIENPRTDAKTKSALTTLRALKID